MIAFTLPPYSALVVAIALILALHWLRKPGRGGALGRRIRESDHQAWRDAMDHRQHVIDDLTRRQRISPRPFVAIKIEELRRELIALRALEPKV